LELVVRFVGAGMVGLVGEQVTAAGEFVAPHGSVPADRHFSSSKALVK